MSASEQVRIIHQLEKREHEQILKVRNLNKNILKDQL